MDRPRCLIFAMWISIISTGVFAAGCVDNSHDEVPELRDGAAAQSNCGHYDKCGFIAVEEIKTWRESLMQSGGDPVWRDVQIHGPNTATVTFYPEELNLGLLPIDEQEGDYESAEEFTATVNELLGVNTDSKEVEIIQEGTSAKLPKSMEGDVLNTSTGTFMIDALTDEQGMVYIDGQPIFVEDEADHHSSSSGASTEPLSSSPLSARTTAFQAWWSHPTFGIYMGRGTKITRLRVDGNMGSWSWQSWPPGFYWEQYTADSMTIENRYFDHSGQEMSDSPSSRKREDVSRLRYVRGSFFNQLGGVCGSTVVERGNDVVNDSDSHGVTDGC